MPTPRLQLPADDRAKAFRGLVALLQRDPDLKRVVKTWRSWEGKDNEAVGPTVGECPWVRLTPSPDPSSWSALADDDGGPEMLQPQTVTIETAVAGTMLENSVNLWGAIESAIYRGGPKPLEEIGISGVTVKQPGWGTPSGEAGQVDMLTGVGSITLTIYITP